MSCQIISFPLKAGDGTTMARDILEAMPGTFTDEEIGHAAEFLRTWSPLWLDQQLADMSLSALAVRREYADLHARMIRVADESAQIDNLIRGIVYSLAFGTLMGAIFGALL